MNSAWLPFHACESKGQGSTWTVTWSPTWSPSRYLTIVFAALAIARHLQNETGVSIKRIVRTLRPLRTVQIRVGGQTITAAPLISPDAREILDHLPPITAPGH